MWNIGWAPSNELFIDSGEDFFIAQVTLSEDTEGSWTYAGNVGGLVLELDNLWISGGVMRLIPEPTTMSLLALGALVASAGRRK